MENMYDSFKHLSFREKQVKSEDVGIRVLSAIMGAGARSDKVCINDIEWVGSFCVAQIEDIQQMYPHAKFDFYEPSGSPITNPGQLLCYQRLNLVVLLES